MSSPDAAAAAAIVENSKELDRLSKEQEEVLMEINKIHNKLQSTPEVVENPGDNTLANLKLLYTRAKELSESEVTISGQLVTQLDTLIQSAQPAAGLQQRRRIGELPKKD